VIKAATLGCLHLFTHHHHHLHLSFLRHHHTTPALSHNHSLSTWSMGTTTSHLLVMRTKPVTQGIFSKGFNSRGLYSPPGIPPGIRLESRNSARLITEFDILAESARNIMGIMFLLLCLVIPYRVRPESMKKKMKSVDRPVDFHGTSLRSSCEIICM